MSQILSTYKQNVHLTDNNKFPYIVVRLKIQGNERLTFVTKLRGKYSFWNNIVLSNVKIVLNSILFNENVVVNKYCL